MRTHTVNIFSPIFVAVLSLCVAQCALAKGPPDKVEVNHADPSELYQGEEDTVTVTGSGFDDESSVSFLITGTNDGSQVEVISVEYISPNELKTRIRPIDNALPTDYDIEVRTASGRKGKGTTLFRVKQKPNEVTCTDTLPEIVFVRDHSGYIEQDIVLSSATGCLQTTLVENSELGGQSVFAPRLELASTWGVVVWYTYDAEPWTLYGVIFDYDGEGNIYPDSTGPSFSYTSPLGFNAVEADVHMTEAGDILLAVTEIGPLADTSHRLITVVDLATGSREVAVQVACESVQGCLVPSLRRISWNPSGDGIYFEYNNWIDDSHGIARVHKEETGWGQPVVVIPGEPGGEYISSPSVSAGGLLAYGYDIGVYRERGRKVRDARIGIVDPEYCAMQPNGCLAQDGELGVVRRGRGASWTQRSTLLFGATDSEEIREYIDPILAIPGELVISNAGQFDSVP